MTDPIFLTKDQVQSIQKYEADLTNSPTLVRDPGALEAALAEPQAGYRGEYSMDLFEMASAYVIALAFLSINGYLVEEKRDEELADLIGKIRPEPP